MTQHSFPPFVDIQGVRNFRDFGGHATASGQVKSGHLFRSANFAAITDQGIAALQDTQARLIVDLRRGPERINSPSRALGAGVETILSSLGDGDGITLPPHLQFIKEGDLSVEACHNHMLASYRRIPWETQNATMYHQTFERLSQGEGPLVIHCAAGKDRTGILAGLILHVLGASLDDIMADYLLSNAVPLDTPWLNDYAGRMSVMFNKHVDPLTLLPMLGVHHDYLLEAWAEMGRRDGGLDGYLGKIGVTDQMCAALRAHLTLA